HTHTHTHTHSLAHSKRFFFLSCVHTHTHTHAYTHTDTHTCTYTKILRISRICPSNTPNFAFCHSFLMTILPYEFELKELQKTSVDLDFRGSRVCMNVWGLAQSKCK